MVEAIKDKENITPTATLDSNADVVVEKAKEPEKPKGGELLTFGAGLKSSGGLQKHFERFRKAKKEEI